MRAPVPLPGEEKLRFPVQTPVPPASEAASEAILRLRQILTTASKGAVTLTGATVLSGERRERIETTAGRAASWSTTAASLVASVVGKSGGERYSSRILAAAPTVEELPVARLAHLGIDRVLLPLAGRPCPEGKSDLVIDPLVAGHLIGRLAPLFFGDTEQELLQSWTKGSKEPFASSIISLIDTPEAPGGTVRVVRDAEGTPKRRSLLVDRGHLAGLLTDVAAAARLETQSTGNSVRLTWSAEPEIGATNFHVDPSPGISPIEILKSVSRGVYAAVLLERPAVDFAEDRFRIAACGYSIDKGRPSGKLSEIILTGRLSTLLRSILAIGDDPKFVSVPGGGAGSPTLLIPKWKFS
jgi:PmbA protein